MTTSGGGGLNALAYAVVIFAMFRGIDTVIDAGACMRRPHRSALVLWSMVAVPSAAQFAAPAVYDALSRQPDAIRHGHQWWRLITSAYVQDGGVFGTVTNLVVLYIVAALAVPLWGGLRAGGLFVFATAAFNLPAVYLYPSTGGGNSGATFFLATSILSLLLVRRRTRGVVVASGVAVIVGVVLMVTRDAHGLAFTGGSVVGLALATVTHPAATSAGSAARPERR